MIRNNLRNEESEEFLAVLQTSLAAAGMEDHPCTSLRWQHHSTGVTRTLGVLSNLEPHLDRPFSEARVLDLGCASGSASVAFALRGCHHVVGLDPVREPLGLRLAQARAAGWNVGIGLTQGDGCHLPYQSASFDFCFCDWVIEHLPEQATLLSEIHRVLAPDGMLYVATNNRLWPKEVHSGLWFTSWMPHRWAGHLAIQFGRYSDNASWDVWLLTYKQLMTLVRHAGFESVATHQGIFPRSSRWFAPLLHISRRLGLPVDAFRPNLYVLARKAAA
jgi:ubiquinone/menaquinone biosynthesis C-methylase UbiE